MHREMFRNLLNPLVLIPVLMLSFCGFSQSVMNPEWVKMAKSPLSSGNSEAWAIGSGSSGVLYWGVNRDQLGFLEYMDAELFQIDEAGIALDSILIYGGPYAQQSYHLRVTDSVVYLGGRTCKALGVDSCDALLVNYNVSGDSVRWTFTFNAGFGYEEIDGISIDDSGIIITGWTAGQNTKVDVLLAKVDHDGNLMWQNSFSSGTARDDHQDGHIVVDDSLIFLCGLYDGSPLLGWEGRALLASFDKNTGGFRDSVLFGRTDSWTNAENALGMISDGNLLYVTGYTTTSANNWDIFTACFDKNLNQLWYQTWGGNDAETARALTFGSDGNLYVAGTTKSYGSGGEEVVLLKYDPLGNLQWYKTWGSTLDDHPLDIHTKNNFVYITGKSNSFHPNQKSESFLLKVQVDTSTTGTNEGIQLANAQPPVLYPNPLSIKSNGLFNINSPHQGHFEIFDLTGSTVHSGSLNKGPNKVQHSKLIQGGCFTIVVSGKEFEKPLVLRLMVI